MNTNWRTSQWGCCCRQSLRAALTSGRSCSAARVVFFIAQTELCQTVPQSGDANGNLQLLQTTALEFAEGQIRLRRNPSAQGSVMLFQAGAPAAADLFGPAPAGQTVLLPKTLNAFTADAKTPANLTSACSAFPRRDDPLPQILTQRPHNSPFIKCSSHSTDWRSRPRKGGFSRRATPSVPSRRPARWACESRLRVSPPAFGGGSPARRRRGWI